MENEPRGRVAAQHAVVHCYDTRARRIACGAPGQIGSTKYARDVTCAECLALPREPSQSALRLTTGEDATTTH